MRKIVNEGLIRDGYTITLYSLVHRDENSFWTHFPQD